MAIWALYSVQRLYVPTLLNFVKRFELQNGGCCRLKVHAGFCSKSIWKFSPSNGGTQVRIFEGVLLYFLCTFCVKGGGGLWQLPREFRILGKLYFKGPAAFKMAGCLNYALLTRILKWSPKRGKNWPKKGGKMRGSFCGCDHLVTEAKEWRFSLMWRKKCKKWQNGVQF